MLGSAVLPEPALPLGGRRLRVPCRPGTRDVFHFSQQLDEFQRQAGGFAPRHGAP